MVAMLVRPGAPCFGLSMRSMLNFTAAASKGSPLWNFTLRLSLSCQFVSLTWRHDSATLPSSWSVLMFLRSSVSKIWRSGWCAFLSQCMCQSRVAASPDCTPTTGLGCAEASGTRHSSIPLTAAVSMLSRRVIENLLPGGVSPSSELVHTAAPVEIGIEGAAERITDEFDGHERHEVGRPWTPAHLVM